MVSELVWVVSEGGHQASKDIDLGLLWTDEGKVLLIGLFEAFDGRVMQKADQICGSDLDQTAIQRFVTDPPRLFEQLLNSSQSASE